MIMRVRERKRTDKNKKSWARALNVYYEDRVVGGWSFHRQCALSADRGCDKGDRNNAVISDYE